VLSSDPTGRLNDLIVLHLIRTPNQKTERDINHGESAARLCAGLGRAVALVRLDRSHFKGGLFSRLRGRLHRRVCRQRREGSGSDGKR
jgi:hypothetical protein